MRNKFAASCSKCGQIVAIGAGETNLQAGKWHTEHLPGGCQAVATVPTGGFYGSVHWRDFDDDDGWHDPFDTSETVNPNEGCK